VVLFFAFTAAGNILDTLQLEQDEAALGDEVTELEERYGDLTEVRDYLESDEYVEWVARRELGLVRPGEIGIIVLPRFTPTAVAEGEEAAPSGAAEPQPRWWEVVAGH
jgi:cell division protein FtsB